MARAQASLEYLIILSVIIAIVALVSLLVLSGTQNNQQQYILNLCREAASVCKINLGLNPIDPCMSCETSCVFPNGTEIFQNATNCCKVGKSDSIYIGSNECSNLCRSSVDCGGAACCDGVCCASGQVCANGECVTWTGCKTDSDCNLNPSFCELQKCVITDFTGQCVIEPDPAKIGYECASPTYGSTTCVSSSELCTDVTKYTCDASGKCTGTLSKECERCGVCDECRKDVNECIPLSCNGGLICPSDCKKCTDIYTGDCACIPNDQKCLG